MKMRITIEADFDHEHMLGYTSYREEGPQGVEAVQAWLDRDRERGLLGHTSGKILKPTAVTVEEVPE